MSLKLKSVVLFFKILTCFLLPRPFGKVINNYYALFFRSLLPWKQSGNLNSGGDPCSCVVQVLQMAVSKNA